VLPVGLDLVYRKVPVRDELHLKIFKLSPAFVVQIQTQMLKEGSCYYTSNFSTKTRQAITQLLASSVQL
jgi:hypothetical protein